MKREELKNYDGKDGRPAYVVYKNKIYDVTDSRLWKKGLHMNRHKAGEDLTDFLSMAPHGDNVFEKFKYIGEIEEEEVLLSNKDKLRKLYSKYHPHPILIHYPMGVLSFGYLLLLLYSVTGNRSFEAASFYALIFGSLFIVPTVAAGVFSWYVNYEMTMTKIFTNKLYYSIALTLIAIGICILRVVNPNIMFSCGIAKLIYIAGYTLVIPVMTYVAYNGGKITWPQ